MSYIPPMRMLYLDLETYYSTEYSLTRMDPPSYVLDPRFEVIMMGVAFDDGPVTIIDGPDVEGFLSTLDPAQIATVSHNAQFDASILSWRYNFRPKLIIDTLSISRTVIANRSKRHDLGSVAAYLGLPPKGLEVHSVKGMTRANIIEHDMWAGYADYCKGDTELCREIYKRLSPDLPDEELLVHDLVLRMAVDPVLKADPYVLAEHLAEVVSRKETILARAMLLGIDGKSDLMSNDKFAEVLRGLGVTPPSKISPATGVPTYAFAKTDEEFQALREHPNPVVVDLVEARLGYKSTIEETRAARLLNISQLDFPHHGPNMMPIALRIGGARTHRLSGDWKCNFQNMGRGSKIREAIVTPPGNTLVTADAAQIEARILAWYCGQTDLVEQFRRGEDVYATFASRLFGRVITKGTFPVERFVGKQGVLGCGYGCGPPKFLGMIRTKAVIEGFELQFDIDDAERVVKGYRKINNMIEFKWNWLGQEALHQMAYRDNEKIEDGPVTFRRYEVTGPSNLKMHYPLLQKRDGEWTYDDAGKSNKLYGAKLTENLVQHMARVFIMQVALRMERHVRPLSGRLVLQSHDELVYCVPDPAVELLKGLLHKEMTTPPPWAPGLPLATDVKSGPNYGACK